MGVMNRFWHDAERGPTGDHGQAGQDGRDGHIGETGPRGPAGGITQGDKGERGLRGRSGGSTPALRARMMVLYLVVIVLLVAVAVIYQRGETTRKRDESVRDGIRSVLVTNCYDNRANTINFNQFLDKLIKTYEKSRVLTAKERKQRVDFFKDAKGAVPTCPPRGLPKP